MDKLMDNNLFLKVIALALALLLFITVNFESRDKTGQAGSGAKSSEEVIENVPVNLIYDEENLYVSGVPEFVTVTIDGPNAILQTTKTLRNFEVYLDLTDEQIGEKRVPFQIKDISDKLDVKIEPSYAQVSIQERISKEFVVEAEYNPSMIAEDYYADEPTVEPRKVVVTGAKDVIDEITYVKATVENIGEVNKTVTREAEILVLDEKLNKLPVTVEPERVQVTIPVHSLSRTVPIEIEEIGQLPEGVVLESLKIDTDEAIITTRKEDLDIIESVKVQVDLSKIKESTRFKAQIILNDKITKINPEIVNVTASVIVEADLSLARLPVEFVGMKDDYELEFIKPSNGQLDLTATGPGNIVTSLKKTDFKLTIDVKDLEEGQHKIKVDVEGPDDISWKLEQEEVTVKISKKD